MHSASDPLAIVLGLCLSALSLTSGAALQSAAGGVLRPDAVPSVDGHDADRAPDQSAQPLRLDLGGFEVDGRAGSDPEARHAPLFPRRTLSLPRFALYEHLQSAEAIVATAAATAETLPARQALGLDGLIHNSQGRHTRVSAFGFGSSTQIRGFASGTGAAWASGVTDPVTRDDRAQGVLFEHHKALSDDAALTLVGGWLSGTRAEGYGSTRHGSAWSLGGDAKLLQRVSLSLEYAGTRDVLEVAAPGSEPRRGATIDPRRGEAYRMGASIRGGHDTGWNWQLDSKYTRVGAQFASVANPGLTTDREQLRTHGRIAVDDWRFDLVHLRNQNNLADDPATATRHNDALQFTTSWKPADAPLDDWLGEPHWRVKADMARAAQHTGDGPLQDIDTVARLALETEFKLPRLVWGLRYSGSQAPGAIDAAVPDGIATTRVEIFGDFRKHAALPLKPVVTWQRRVDRESGARDTRLRAGVRSATLTMGNAWHADFDLGLLHHMPDGTRDNGQAVSVGASLAWTLQRPNSDREGLALMLQGKYRGGRTELVAGSGDDEIELMLSLSSSNPLLGW